MIGPKKTAYEIALGKSQLVEAMADYVNRKQLWPNGAVEGGIVGVTTAVGSAEIRMEVPLIKAPRSVDYRSQRDALWALLDNIDTLDDACREHDDKFRELSRKHLKKRFEIYNPDLDEKKS